VSHVDQQGALNTLLPFLPSAKKGQQHLDVSVSDGSLGSVRQSAAPDLHEELKDERQQTMEHLLEQLPQQQQRATSLPTRRATTLTDTESDIDDANTDAEVEVEVDESDARPIDVDLGPVGSAKQKRRRHRGKGDHLVISTSSSSAAARQHDNDEYHNPGTPKKSKRPKDESNELAASRAENAIMRQEVQQLQQIQLTAPSPELKENKLQLTLLDTAYREAVTQLTFGQYQVAMNKPSDYSGQTAAAVGTLAKLITTDVEALYGVLERCFPQTEIKLNAEAYLNHIGRNQFAGVGETIKRAARNSFLAFLDTHVYSKFPMDKSIVRNINELTDLEVARLPGLENDRLLQLAAFTSTCYANLGMKQIPSSMAEISNELANTMFTGIRTAFANMLLGFANPLVSLWRGYAPAKEFVEHLERVRTEMAIIAVQKPPPNSGEVLVRIAGQVAALVVFVPRILQEAKSKIDEAKIVGVELDDTNNRGTPQWKNTALTEAVDQIQKTYRWLLGDVLSVPDGTSGYALTQMIESTKKRLQLLELQDLHQPSVAARVGELQTLRSEVSLFVLWDMTNWLTTRVSLSLSLSLLR
jgi:hypothetical protein